MPRRRPTVDTLLFIPDDIVIAFQDEAIVQVAETWATRPLRARTPTADQAAPTSRSPSLLGLGTAPKPGVLLFAALLALVGWAVCTGIWTWFAIDTGSTTWAALAGIGGITMVAGVVATTRLMLKPTRRPQPAAHPGR